MRRLAAILAVGLALGCATSASKTTWVKSGTTAEERERAERACTAEAGAEFNRDANRPTAGSRTAQTFRACMERRGWQRVKAAE